MSYTPKLPPGSGPGGRLDILDYSKMPGGGPRGTPRFDSPGSRTLGGITGPSWTHTPSLGPTKVLSHSGPGARPLNDYEAAARQRQRQAEAAVAWAHQNREHQAAAKRTQPFSPPEPTRAVNSHLNPTLPKPAFEVQRTYSNEEQQKPENPSPKAARPTEGLDKLIQLQPFSISNLEAALQRLPSSASETEIPQPVADVPVPTRSLSTTLPKEVLPSVKDSALQIDNKHVEKTAHSADSENTPSKSRMKEFISGFLDPFGLF
jgi:hypothetical protein